MLGKLVKFTEKNIGEGLLTYFYTMINGLYRKILMLI